MPEKRAKTKVVRVPDGKLRDIWDTLDDAQRDALVAELVESAESGVAVAPDADEAARHARVVARLRQNRGGRPRVGRGAAKFNVTMERSLLERVDAYARQNRLSRAAVLAQGVEMLMKA